jgi:hypothetical protein
MPSNHTRGVFDGILPVEKIDHRALDARVRDMVRERPARFQVEQMRHQGFRSADRRRNVRQPDVLIAGACVDVFKDAFREIAELPVGPLPAAAPAPGL